MTALTDAQSWLKGLTLWPTKDGKWQASTTRDGIGWRVVIDADPELAMTKALGGEPPVSEIPDDTGDIFG